MILGMFLVDSLKFNVGFSNFEFIDMNAKDKKVEMIIQSNSLNIVN